MADYSTNTLGIPGFVTTTGIACPVTLCKSLLTAASTHTLFTILQSDMHLQRRQKVSGILSQSFLQCSPDLMALTKMILFSRLLPIIEHCRQTCTPINMAEINDAIAVDLITGFVFGSSVGTNLLQNSQLREDFLTYHRQERSYGFWPQEIPLLTAFLKILGVSLVPGTAITASKWLEAWFIRSLKIAEANSIVDLQTHQATQAIMYRHLRPFFNADSESAMRELVAELHDHCVAGYETTGHMLTYTMHALSSQRAIQAHLRSEIRTLRTCPFFDEKIPSSELESTELPTPAQIANLPILHAIVIETLRLRDRGPLPRVTPNLSVSITGSPPLPPNVRVSAASYVLHHDPQVFPSPSEWDPLRWLESPQAPGAPEKRGRMGKSFIAFGSGSRTCVGRDFAMFEMKAVLAVIYANYETTLADGQAEVNGTVLQQSHIRFARVEKSQAV